MFVAPMVLEIAIFATGILTSIVSAITTYYALRQKRHDRAVRQSRDAMQSKRGAPPTPTT
jgi:hypothetical protein